MIRAVCRCRSFHKTDGPGVCAPCSCFAADDECLTLASWVPRGLTHINVEDFSTMAALVAGRCTTVGDVATSLVRSTAPGNDAAAVVTAASAQGPFVLIEGHEHVATFVRRWQDRSFTAPSCTTGDPPMHSLFSLPWCGAESLEVTGKEQIPVLVAFTLQEGEPQKQLDDLGGCGTVASNWGESKIDATASLL